MARYAIFDGGNARAYPWDTSYQSAIDPSYAVRYSAHLTNFHKVLRYHVDPNDEYFNNWLGDMAPSGRLNVGDELVLHLYGPGTVIEHFVVQVKGLCPPPATNGAAGAGAAAHTTPPQWAFSIQDEFGTQLKDLGTVTMNALGFTPKLNVDQFIAGNGVLVAKLVAGDYECGCFGAMVSLVQLIDPMTCACRPIICDSPLPDPDCGPDTGVNSSSLYATGLAATAGDAPGEPGYQGGALRISPRSVTVTHATGDNPVLTLSGYHAAMGAVTWSLSDPAIGTLADTGSTATLKHATFTLAAGKKTGTVTVTASTATGGSATAKLTVNVP